jgi:tRNA pseudouridine55 synthase
VIGVLNLDKPEGATSGSVIGRLKRSSGERRVGHGGTLDPLASGVLPLFFGRATRLAGHVSGSDKQYTARIRFGAGSTTDDREGQLEPAPLSQGLDAAAVERALGAFTGAYDQRPPAYSAVKVGGKRSYRLARRAESAGEPLPELEPRGVEVRALRLVALEEGGAPGPLAVVEIECGSGFYVRSLARDLGIALGTRAHLESLIRTRVGGLRLADAMGLEEAEILGVGLAGRLLPASAVIGDLLEVAVSADAEARLRDGQGVPAGEVGDGDAYAAGAGGRVLAVGRVEEGRFLPHRLVDIS